MTTRIPLSGGRTALIDDVDAERVLAEGRWSSQVDGRTAYARKHYYHGGGRKAPVRSSVLLHTFLTGWAYVDHVNGDGLDNRRANLRQSTHALNMANKRCYRNSTSGYKGVTRNSGRGRPWTARIRAGGRWRRLGNYDTPEDAARAHDVAARETWGEFARPNFPFDLEDIPT